MRRLQRVRPLQNPALLRGPGRGVRPGVLLGPSMVKQYVTRQHVLLNNLASIRHFNPDVRTWCAVVRMYDFSSQSVILKLCCLL